ncbi:hypothetical protein [Streptomyces sp. NPDC005322]|uniref:hypothetical protein n=1 Tax=Streptomyces sp. NPDC005322 TaxID=3157032 RepID=UPI0033AADB83
MAVPVVGPSSAVSDVGSTYGFAAAYLLMPTALVRAAVRTDVADLVRIGHAEGTATPEGSGQETTPGPLAWGFVWSG